CIQPRIAPLYGGKTAHEVLTVLSGQAEQSPHDTVRQNWQGSRTDADFDVFWQTALHDGFVPNTTAAALNVTAKPPTAPTNRQPAQGIEIALRPDPTIWDGSF